MKITLNGQKKELLDSVSLKEIVNQFCKDNQHIVSEVNGEIIKTPQWPNTQIKDGDTIELLSFVGGG